MSHERQEWQRWHALQIVSQLPEETKDALAILEYAKEFLETCIIQGGSNGVAQLICRLAPEARYQAAKSVGQE